MMAEPQQAPADPVADILRSVPAPNDVRQQAWSIYDAATDADDLAEKLKEIPLARSVKQQLWNLKEAATAQPHDIALTIGAPSPSPILAPNPLSWRMGAVGPVGMGNTTDAADQPAGRVAKLAAELEHAALPDTGFDLTGLLLQGEAGGALMDRVVSPVARGIGKYGGATVDLLKALLPARARAAVEILHGLNPGSWNSPLTVAGREARAANTLPAQNARAIREFFGPETPAAPAAPIRVNHAPPDVFERVNAAVRGEVAPGLDARMPNRSGVPTTAPGAVPPRMTEQRLAQLLREHDAAVAGTAVPKAKPIPAAAPPAAAVPPPLPRLSAQDVKQIKDLIAKGATQDEAVAAIFALRGYPKAWQTFAISRVLRPSK